MLKFYSAFKDITQLKWLLKRYGAEQLKEKMTSQEILRIKGK